MPSPIQRYGPDAPIAEVIAALSADGAVVVTDVVSATDVEQMHRELDPHVARRSPGHGDGAAADFWGRNTKRFQGLHAKSATFVSAVVENPTLLAIANDLLGAPGSYWVSQTELIFIGPGEPAQTLHRDDLNWQLATGHGYDVLFSALVSVGDYDVEVGATVVVPGSHRWPAERVATAGEGVPVEMSVGDALVYLGSVHHGGGHNATDHRWRQALYCGFLRSWLTPEEATALALTPEAAAALSPRARQLLGWSYQRGNSGSSGVEDAMALWQLDDDDADRIGPAFTNP